MLSQLLSMSHDHTLANSTTADFACRDVVGSVERLAPLPIIRAARGLGFPISRASQLGTSEGSTVFDKKDQLTRYTLAPL